MTRGIQRGFWRGLLVAAWLSLACLARAAGAPGTPEAIEGPPATTIHTIAEFWAVQDRETVRPIKIEITVNYYDPVWGHIWCECNGVPGYLFAQKPLPIRSGDRVLIEGSVMVKYGISPDLVHVTVLQHGLVTQPLSTQGELGDSTRFAKRVVTIESATFDQEHLFENHLLADFIAEGYRVHVYSWGNPPKALGFRPGTRARLTGVYNGNHDPQTASLEVDLWVVSNNDIVATGDPENDPRFAEPLVPIGELNRLYLEMAPQAHVAGVVREYEPGHRIVLRDGTGQVIAQTLQTLPVQIGDVVEANGFIFTGGADWLLRHAVIRRASPQAIAAMPVATQSSTLRLTDQVLELTAKQAAKEMPVDLLGVVIWAAPNADFFYLRDSSGSIRVQLGPKMSEEPKLHAQIRVRGVTESGVFAPQILVSSLDVVGGALLPEPKILTLEQAMTGLQEGQRAEMSGHVQRVTSEGDWSHLTLSTQTGTFTVLLPRDDSMSDIVGSIVSVQGICRAVANARRELTGIEILAMKRADIRVEQAALADPFGVPLREISALRQFRGGSDFNFWTRVKGTVTYQLPGRFIFVQDEAEGLLIFSTQTTPVVPGDEIEITGLPGLENNRVVLREAVYRKTHERSAEPVPMEIRDPGKLDDTLDGRLVNVTGTLISTAADGDSIRLALQSERALFSAMLPRSANDRIDEWQPGSVLALVGVYEVVRDEQREPHGFRLQLRSPTDITVLRYPSWWTPARAFAVTGLLVGCIVLGLSWVGVLRRRVTEQTDQIREQLAKEAKLEAHHRAIIAHATDVIFTTDLSGNFTSFNPAGERLLGYPRVEALTMNLRDIIAPEDAERRNAVISTLPELNQSAARFELRLVTKDGKRIWMEINACLIQHEGATLGVLGVARDIAERKQIEEELKRARDAAQANTEAKSAFLANMSHEIRTPMNGVIGMSNLLLETALNDDQREYAETIRNSAESLLTVLNDILDFSKIEAGKLHFEIQDFDLGNVVEETLELLATRAAAKNIELTLFISPEIPRTVRGDPGRLRQVLINLAGNAVKFTETGEVSVAATLLEQRDGKATYRFEVRDTGIGIPADAIEKLFHPFTQADASTTRRFGGTGLGLAISKQIVDLMHGEIGVESEEGHGSTFWFTAQFEINPEIQLRPPPDRSIELVGLRLLVVDDHAVNRRLVCAYATAWGMRADSAGDAKEAMLAMRNAAGAGDPYRIVLIDYRMPGKDGLALAREIRAERQLHDPAIALLTSVDRRFSVEETGPLRIRAVVTKPLHARELASAIRKAIVGNGTSAGLLPRERSKDPNEGPAPSRPLRVLVAEDNVVNQRLVLLQLEKLGYRADIAGNGVEVLDALERSSYDVILMDCQMPEMDGYETTRAIRRNPNHQHVRIIAMTANAMQGDRQKCLAAGMNDYLTKPTRIDQLREALMREQNRLSVASV